jgi:hypothetical protein
VSHSKVVGEGEVVAAAAEETEAEEEEDATVDANEAGCWRFFRACRIEGEELGDCEEDDDVRLCLRIFWWWWSADTVERNYF